MLLSCEFISEENVEVEDMHRMVRYGCGGFGFSICCNIEQFWKQRSRGMLLHDEIDNVAYLTYLLAIRWGQQCLESMADDVVSATMVCLYLYIYKCTVYMLSQSRFAIFAIRFRNGISSSRVLGLGRRSESHISATKLET